MPQMEDSVRIRTLDGQYRIIGGGFQEMLALVRDFTGRRYRPDERIWEIRLTSQEVQKAAEEAGFHLTSDTEMGHALQAPSNRPRRGAADRVMVRVGADERAVVGGVFADMLEVIKAVEGRQWLPREHVWKLPGTLDEAQAKLGQIGYRLVTQEEADQLPATESERVPPPPPSAAAQAPRRDQIRIRTTEGEALVVGGGFRDMLQAIKEIEGRRFISDSKLWDIPGSLAAVRAVLAERGYAVELPGEAPAAPPATGASPQSARPAPAPQPEPDEEPPFFFGDEPPDDEDDPGY